MPVLRAILVIVAAVLLAACDYPKDPEGTLQSVQGAVLRAGSAGQDVPEADRTALEAIAAAADAELEIETGEIHALAARVDAGELDILAGLPENTPFASRLSVTRSYGEVHIDSETAKRVMLVRKGENAFLIFVNRNLPEGGQ